jgi:hypothetical protein
MGFFISFAFVASVLVRLIVQTERDWCIGRAQVVQGCLTRLDGAGRLLNWGFRSADLFRFNGQHSRPLSLILNLNYNTKELNLTMHTSG